MTDFYVKEDNTLLDNYKCDQSIIIEKNYLKYINTIRFKEKSEKFQKSIDWWPNCNSYYAYLEDTDALNRKETLQNAYRSDSRISISTECWYEDDCYNERDAQNKYLSTPPVSFIILGKPGIGEQEFGKLLANYWGCVYIDPETLIEEEIASGSRPGQCIEYNLRCGRAISSEVIMRLAEKRTKSKSATHRGFVLCGFPLVTNDLYEEDPVSSESAIFNVQEIFDEFVDSIIPGGGTTSVIQLSVAGSVVEEDDEEVEGEETLKEEKPIEMEKKYEITPDIGSANFPMVASDTYKSVEHQIDHLFSFMNDPFIFIYIACDNAEVVNKRTNYRYDILADQVIDMHKEEVDKMIYSIFSSNPTETSELPEGFIYLTKYDTIGIDYSNRYDLLKLPRDFKSSVATQLDKYRQEALITIEKYALMHDPQYVVKVDGRVSPCRMFYTLKLRLDTLSFGKPIIPQKLYVPEEPTGAENEVIEELNFDGLSLKECFEILSRKQIASPMFKWSLSDWGTKCPVYMKDGIYVDGDPKYAVQFMNKIFFLSDEMAFLNFYRNPRPYLLPPFPKLSSKIYVMGPKNVAKQAVAKCLGYLLNIKVIFMHQLQDEFLNRKREEYVNKVRSNAFKDIIYKLADERKQKYESLEIERNEKLENWKSRILQLLEWYKCKVTYVSSESTIEESIEETNFEEESIECEPIQITVEEIEQELAQHNIQCACNFEEILENPNYIYQYAPDDLLIPTSYQAPNEEDEEVLQYVNTVVANIDLSTIQLTLDEIIEIYITAIKDIEENDSSNGWIVCGIAPDIKLIESLEANYPDEVFILTDPTENHQFLLDRFQRNTMIEFNDFKEFFTNLGKMDVAFRCPLSSTLSYKGRMVNECINAILDRYATDDDSDELTEEEYFRFHPRRAEIDAYSKQLEEYDVNIVKIKEIFESKNISITELNVAYKSIRNLLFELIVAIEKKFRQAATVLTPEEREEELKDFGEPLLIADEEEAEAEEEPLIDDAANSFLRNRRYGDTYYYCPVAFKEKFVLWRGKDELGAKFESKVYFFHSEEALDRFIDDPKSFLFKDKPPEIFPPPRICITGLPGSGKTTLSKRLANNIGVYYLNFIDKVKEINEEEFYNYLENGEALSEQTLNQVLISYWFEEPKRSTGFVIDGFPRRISDVDYMISTLTIPDMIIDLTAMEVILQERLRNDMLENWRIKLEEEKTNKEALNSQLLQEWQERHTAYVNEILNDMRQVRYEKERARKLEKEEAAERRERNVVRIASQISYNSIAEQEEIEKARMMADEKFPPPDLLESWPNEDEMIITFVDQITTNYNRELEFTSGIKDACNNQIIPWTSIDANLDKDRTFAQIMKLVDPFKYRNQSLFERCYDISTELADTLLSSGYYFLSKFGRTCPVQYYNKYDTFQLYLTLTEKFRIYPVIYRQYIYFLGGKKNHDQFVTDPLKYTSISFEFPLIPFRIGIIGPPKTGKTTLAERFHFDHGLKHISIGKAARYVLNFMSYTELAKNIEEVLRNGWQLTPEMEMKCVQAMCFEASATALGCIFDGFPNNLDEVRHLAQLGILPHIVIDLKSNEELIDEFRSSINTKDNVPIFSKLFIDYRYNIWSETQEEFRKWLDAEYQIIAEVTVKPCKWGVWHSAYDLAAASLFEVRFYHIHADHETALRLSYMQVSPMEYVHRRSSYKEYCVCCLYDGALTCGNNPPDRTVLVQWKYYYYCLCEEHVEEFIRDPEKYIAPYNPNKLPQDVPEIVYPTEDQKDLFHEDGYCIVCYTDALPQLVMHEGVMEFAAKYLDKIYLFCICKCRNIFMKYPQKYFNVKINFKGHSLSELEIKELPIQGYLEQFLSHQIIKAVTNTVNKRPLICGLSIDISAALNTALYLKINNPKLSEEILPVYQNAFKLFENRRKRFINFLNQRKSTLNPFLYYEDPIPPLVLSDESSSVSNSSQNSNVNSMASIINTILCFNQES